MSLIAGLARAARSLASSARSPQGRVVGLGLLSGALCFFVFGQTPAAVSRASADESAWSLSAPAPDSMQSAASVLAASAFWVSQPAPALSAANAQPIILAPRLVGVIDDRRRAVGVFQLDGGGRLRAGAGDAVGDAIVEIILPTRATIRLKDGRSVELRLLDAPSPPVAL